MPGVWTTHVLLGARESVRSAQLASLEVYHRETISLSLLEKR